MKKMTWVKVRGELVKVMRSGSVKEEVQTLDFMMKALGDAVKEAAISEYKEWCKFEWGEEWEVKKVRLLKTREFDLDDAEDREAIDDLGFDLAMLDWVMEEEAWA